jgi:hypothetical protein
MADEKFKAMMRLPASRSSGGPPISSRARWRVWPKFGHGVGNHVASSFACCWSSEQPECRSGCRQLLLADSLGLGFSEHPSGISERRFSRHLIDTPI